jgi:hypothetical protein
MSSPLAPPDLHRNPAVRKFLHRLGLGDFVPDRMHSFPGRNDNWAGPTTSGASVFIKRLAGSSRLERILEFEQLARGHIDAPACLGWDADSRLVAFELLPDAHTGHELAVDEEFTPGQARRAGEMLGVLHNLPADGLPVEEPPVLPSLADLNGLPAEIFANSSAAELHAWRLMQGDRQLRAAITDLLDRELTAPRVPAHCDLRLDQFLLSGGRLHLIDWEEFRAMDAARDIGGFAGEWLRRAVVGLWRARDHEPEAVEPELSHEDIMRIGTAELERLRPLITEFWRAYRSVREPDAELAARATGFAGWHMFDRMLAAAAQRPRIGGIDLAAAGIGRNALLRPDEFAAVLGFLDA